MVLFFSIRRRRAAQGLSFIPPPDPVDSNPLHPFLPPYLDREGPMPRFFGPGQIRDVARLFFPDRYDRSFIPPFPPFPLVAGNRFLFFFFLTEWTWVDADLFLPFPLLWGLTPSFYVPPPFFPTEGCLFFPVVCT